MDTLLATLLRIAAEQPVLFVVEDLHWADPTTLEWLGLVVEQLRTARILAGLHIPARVHTAVDGTLECHHGDAGSHACRPGRRVGRAGGAR